MVYLDMDSTNGQTASGAAKRFSTGRCSLAKLKRVQEKRRKLRSIYVVTTCVVYEMYHCDEWVHVPDSDDETNVAEAYIRKPSSDVLANIAAREEDAVLKFWKNEGHDTSDAGIETVVDIAYLRRSIVTCGNVRAFVSVELTKTKLKQ